MTAKQRPPLTPAESTYLGLDTFGWHTIAWASQSRSGVTHHTQGKAGCGYSCTCPGWRHRQTCKHVLSFDATLAHHLDPPPAGPGGAVGGPPESAGPTECEEAARDWRDELPPNFGTVAVTPEVLERAFGPTGTPPLAAVGVSAWGNLPATLDEAVADDGDRWIQSRTAAGVRLTCTSCGAVRGWATEVGAIDWLATDGRCSCGGTGPTPPARGAARKPLREQLDLLYGGE